MSGPSQSVVSEYIVKMADVVDLLAGQTDKNRLLEGKIGWAAAKPCSAILWLADRLARVYQCLLMYRDKN